MTNTGWLGCDLDGTLAFYDHWRGDDHIGKPIPLMVARVKDFLKKGHTVKIFTARAYNAKPETIKLIQDWCETYIGQRLEVTCMKDYGMIRLYDDRCVQVIQNTGNLVV